MTTRLEFWRAGLDRLTICRGFDGYQSWEFAVIRTSQGLQFDRIDTDYVAAIVGEEFFAPFATALPSCPDLDCAQVVLRRLGFVESDEPSAQMELEVAA